ncbi:hypothetical protein L6164_005160 [Bauhinia variegata]|nr:hypothetical protein L6164_005160 [Bauhinia variegata]
MGLLSPSLYMYMTAEYVTFMVLFLLLFVALLTKYLEWSTIWEMGTLISVLEEKDGDVALVVSAYFSRGNRISGILLMLFFLVWRFSLRLVGLFFGWNGGGTKILFIVLYIALLCLGNVFKWVAFLVYYSECRKGRSEKEVSASGEGEAISV